MIDPDEPPEESSLLADILPPLKFLFHAGMAGLMALFLGELFVWSSIPHLPAERQILDAAGWSLVVGACWLVGSAVLWLATFWVARGKTAKSDYVDP